MGDLPVKDDVNVTDEDIATKRDLFGDRRRTVSGAGAGPAPLTWTKESLPLAEGYESSSHLPASSILAHSTRTSTW